MVLRYNMGFSPLAINAVKKAITRAPQIFREELLTAMDIALIKGKAVAIQQAPAAFGTLRKGITAFVDPTELRGFLHSQASHSAFVNNGTKPHFPPVAALEDWARLKGVSPFAVAKSIAKKGTKAVPFFTNGSIEARKSFGEELPRAAARAIQRINQRDG